MIVAPAGGDPAGEQNSAYMPVRPLSVYKQPVRLYKVLERKNVTEPGMERYCSISFKEKVNLFSFEYLKCIRFIADVEDEDYNFTKKLYSKLITTSHLLEDLLDFHGAKNNWKWVFYRELCAAVRHLSLAGYSQKHILNRLDFYQFEGGNDQAFRFESSDTFRIVQDSLKIAAGKRVFVSVFSQHRFHRVSGSQYRRSG